MASSQAHALRRWTYLALLALALPVHAIEPDIELRSVRHDTWVDNRIVAAGTRVIAQTPDTRLFLGSPTGIGTFDTRSFQLVNGAGGTRFTSISVVAACTDTDGRLWIGFESGEVGWLRGTEARSFRAAEGPPGGSVLAMACAPDGAVWVAAQRGLARWHHGTWRSFGVAAGVPAGPVSGILSARDGDIWIATPQQLLQSDGALHFAPVGTLPQWHSAPTPMAQTLDGAVWVGSPSGLFRRAPDPGAPLVLWDPEPAHALLVDRDGLLWVGGSDLRRYRAPAAQDGAQRMTHADGLSGNRVNALFEDSDGAIWVATDRGLDLFTRNSFVPLALRLEPTLDLEGDKVLLAGASDSLWVGLTQQSLVLNIAAANRVQRFRVAAPTSGFRDLHGDLWFGGSAGITHFANDVPVTIPLPEAASGRVVRSLARDASGTLWVVIDDLGLLRRVAGRWLAGGGMPGLPEEAPTVVTADAQGRAWLGYLSGALVRIGAKGVEHFDRTGRLDIGMIRTLHASDARMWIGGDKGLQVYDGQRLLPVLARDCGALYSVSGIVETTAGEVWLTRPFGPARFRSGVSEALAGKPMECETFGRDEGIPDSLQVVRGAAPLAWAGERLWVATRSGLAWTDYARSRYTPRPPLVTISGIRGEERYFLVQGDADLEPGTRALQIEYRAWNPERISRTRFRYRVPGVIDQWRYTGSVTTAYLNNLRPGHYVFEVQATANVGDPWSESGRLEFSIRPWFYETLWFHLLVGAALLAAILLLFRLQLRRANLRLRDRLEERTLERERISRELHDTLLQGVQGLILRFQSVAARIPRSQPAAQLMEDALDSADAVLTESRDRVAELRELPPHTTELPEAIAETAQTLLTDRDIRLSSTVKGVVRSLDGGVNSELFLIAREALSNAIRHSGARNLRTELSYERVWLRLSIQDDGQGIPAEFITAGGRPGHFGLRGMRERARRLRATFRIHSEPGQGTLIEIRIPGALAYARELK